jgi:hypothetical protein
MGGGYVRRNEWIEGPIARPLPGRDGPRSMTPMSTSAPIIKASGLRRYFGCLGISDRWFRTESPAPLPQCIGLVSRIGLMRFRPPKSVSFLRLLLSANPIRLLVTPVREVDPRVWLVTGRYAWTFSPTLANTWASPQLLGSSYEYSLARINAFSLGSNFLPGSIEYTGSVLFFFFLFSGTFFFFFGYESLVLYPCTCLLPADIEVVSCLLRASSHVFI